MLSPFEQAVSERADLRRRRVQRRRSFQGATEDAVAAVVLDFRDRVSDTIFETTAAQQGKFTRQTIAELLLAIRDHASTFFAVTLAFVCEVEPAERPPTTPRPYELDTLWFLSDRQSLDLVLLGSGQGDAPLPGPTLNQELETPRATFELPAGDRVSVRAVFAAHDNDVVNDAVSHAMRQVVGNISAVLAFSLPGVTAMYEAEARGVASRAIRHIHERLRSRTIAAARAVYLAASRSEGEQLVEEALGTIVSAFGPNTAASFRTIEEGAGHRALVFSLFAGPAWTDDFQSRARSVRYPIDGTGAVSIGARAVRTRETIFYQDVRRAPGNDPLLPDVTSTLVAPVVVDERVIGTIDVCGISSILPAISLETVSSIASELGVALHILDLVAASQRHAREQEDARAEVERSFGVQRNAQRDLTHQVVTPLSAAHRRSRALVDRLGQHSSGHRNALAVRGLTNKALRVTKSMQQFVELSRTNSLTAERELVESGELLRLTIEAAVDAEFVSIQPVEFEVDREHLLASLPSQLMIDVALCEQALFNLLDNAGKYAVPRTRVDITGLSNFWLDSSYTGWSVTSVGDPIPPEVTKRLILRGVRYTAPGKGDHAGSGTGIGLYLVDRIMAAHDGRVQIDVDGRVTVVSLLFPKAAQ